MQVEAGIRGHVRLGACMHIDVRANVNARTDGRELENNSLNGYTLTLRTSVYVLRAQGATLYVHKVQHCP